ncbi:DUF397 domain-containing protein [Nocardiopsis sp. NPDC006198]|uniref:DUF397 domain-containing protein n=1 Tax=Nocardiopsis sp. NPDC006198 TaxID=3154472 RepID=UPI0033A5151E
MARPSQPEQGPWHKSKRSNGSQNCVEVSEGVHVLVRDTQNRERGHVEFSREAWTQVLRAMK